MSDDAQTSPEAPIPGRPGHETDPPSASPPPSARSPRSLVGEDFGDYRVLRPLGRGGMAEVYLAEQPSLRRKVALKVLRPELAADATYIQRFTNEAQAAASLVDAHIVQIHEVGCFEGQHYIAQEYVPGQNLRQLFERTGPLDPAPAIRVMRQVLAALQKASQRGIVHRDIKPENILITDSGEVKVADFGLARATDGNMALTQVGVTLGTPLYMSPEQAEGKPLDPRSDLYSLGVTCYHMLSGTPPFEGENALALAVQHLKNEPEALSGKRPDLPIPLVQVVDRLLAKRREDRYQQAAEVLRDLKQIELPELQDDVWPSELWAVDTPESERTNTTLADRHAATRQLATVMQHETLRRRRRRNRVLRGTALILLGLVLGGLLAWLRRPDPLLAVSSDQLPRQPHLATAQDQYVRAMLAGTREALASVEEYFGQDGSPQAQYYTRLSKQRRAELALQDEDFDDAERLFRELANVEATESQFRVFGWAGLAVVHARRGDRDEAAAALTAALPELRNLDAGQRKRLYDQLPRTLQVQLEALIRDLRDSPGRD